VAQGAFYATDEESVDEVVRVDEEGVRANVVAFLARRTAEGMEADDLLCSRNARPEKALVGRAQWKIIQPPSLKRERASLEGACISFDARSRKRTTSALVEWIRED